MERVYKKEKVYKKLLCKRMIAAMKVYKKREV